MEIYEWIIRYFIMDGIKYIILGHCFFGYEFSRKKTRYLLLLYPLLLPLVEYLDSAYYVYRNVWGLLVILFLFQGKMVDKLKAFSIMWFLIALVDAIVGIPFLWMPMLMEQSSEVKILIECMGCLFLSFLAWKAKKLQEYTRDFWRGFSFWEYIVSLVVLFIASLFMGGIQAIFYDDIIGLEREWIFILGIVAVIIFFLLCILFFNTRRSKERLEEINRLNSSYLELQRKYYENSLKRYEDMRKFRHDINQHLFMLSKFSEENKISELKKYISELTEIYDKAKGIHTGNFIADCIVSYSLKDLLERKDFELRIDGRFPEKFFMEDIDFCILLSNLLDNAREALMKLPDQKLLHIEFKRYKQWSYLIIRNNVGVDEINFEQTSKTEGYHGYGIQNVKHVVEKYHGTIQWKVVSGMAEVSMKFEICDN